MLKMSRLQTEYTNNVVPTLLKTLNYKNIMMVPKLSKIVISVGCGKYFRDSKKMDFIFEKLKLIACK